MRKNDICLHEFNVRNVEDDMLLSILNELFDYTDDVAIILCEQSWKEVVSYRIVPEDTISKQSYWWNWTKPIHYWKNLLIEEVKNRFHEKDYGIMHYKEGL